MADSLETARKPSPLSVVIPIPNEEPRLGQSLEQAFSALSASGHPCEVTLVAADTAMASVPDLESFPSVRLISLQGGDDWGKAILAASAQARHDLVCTLDAPTLFAAAEVPRLVRALEENDAALVVGVRIGIQQPIPARRRLVPFIVDMLAADALGRPLPDVNSGCRVFPRQVLQECAGRLSTRPALPATLTFLMLAADVPILFVPLDGDQVRGKRPRGRVREVLQLIRLIIAGGLELAPRRTWSLIGRMALMMLMMAAMMLMMMWMMGMLPGLG